MFYTVNVIFRMVLSSAANTEWNIATVHLNVNIEFSRQWAGDSVCNGLAVSYGNLPAAIEVLGIPFV